MAEREERGLLSILTDQIVDGHLDVEEARRIVLRREHYRRAAVRKLGGIESKVSLAEIEAEAIRSALERNQWHRGKTAEELGICKRTVTLKIREYGLRSVAA